MALLVFIDVGDFFMNIDAYRLLTTKKTFRINSKYTIDHLFSGDLLDFSWHKNPNCPMYECSFPVRITTDNCISLGEILVTENFDMSEDNLNYHSAMLYFLDSDNTKTSSVTIVDVVD